MIRRRLSTGVLTNPLLCTHGCGQLTVSCLSPIALGSPSHPTRDSPYFITSYDEPYV